jgi:hypothetical protein
MSFRLFRTALRALVVAGAVGWTSLGARQAVPTQAPAPAGTGMVAGQVIDSETRQGVPSAVVMFVQVRFEGRGDGGSARRIPSPVRTDSQGRFVFTGMAAGTYGLQAQLDGYAAFSGSAVRAVELAPGASVTDVRVPLTKLATIAGAVRDDGGDPVVGVDVLAFRRASVQGRPPVLAGDGRSKTDDRGRYRLVNLLPGDYYICACTRDPIPFDGELLTTLAARPLDLLAVASRAAKAGADTASLDRTLRTFAPTFHPNTTLAGRATRVKASGAAPQEATDITVTAVRAVRVSGRILGAPPNSLNANAVRLIPAGDIPEAVAITQLPPMLVQPDGRFDFAGVAPGQYTLEVRTTPSGTGGGPSGAALAFIGGRGVAPPGGRAGGPPADPLWASQVVSVGDDDVTDLLIGLQAGATITGRLEFAGNSPPPPPPGPQSRANGVQLNAMDPPPRNRSYVATMAADGSFRMPGVIPGRYVVFPFITVPGWPTLKSVTLGGVDITDTIIDVDGRDLPNLVVTVTDTPMAEVRGTVPSGLGGAEEDTWVRMFPAERRFWEAPFGAFSRFRTARVEKNAFTIMRVPAGEYYIVALGEGGLEWMDKATLDALSRSAERISVVNGDKKVIEVKR